MSNTKVLAMLDEAAIRIGDPSYNRVSSPMWLSFFNERARQLSTRLRLVKRRARFSTEADNEAYTYPKNLVQMTRLEFTTTPENAATFRDLGELFEDEWRGATTNTYPTGDPVKYFADQGLLYLYYKPAAVYTRGLRITYWGLSTPIVNPSIEYLPFAEHMRDVHLAGMLADGFSTIEKFDKADLQEQKYERLIAQSSLRLEDRSADRRQSIRPRSLMRGYGGQV